MAAILFRLQNVKNCGKTVKKVIPAAGDGWAGWLGAICNKHRNMIHGIYLVGSRHGDLQTTMIYRDMLR